MFILFKTFEVRHCIKYVFVYVIIQSEVHVFVLVFQKVSEGQEVLVLEAMKMQNSLTAAKQGKV